MFPHAEATVVVAPRVQLTPHLSWAGTVDTITNHVRSNPNNPMWIFEMDTFVLTREVDFGGVTWPRKKQSKSC